jgi:hypothetical protein
MTGGSQLAAVKPWQAEGDGDRYPRYGWGTSTLGKSLNYQFWNPRSFLKLKDLVLSYNLDPRWTKAIGLNATRIYVAATDLITISNWSGIDPENAGTIAANAGSDRYGSNGAYKTVTVGINLTF